MAVEQVKKARVDDTLEMGYYIDDCTDPWKTPDTMVLVPGCLKPRQTFYAWIPTLAREFRVIRPHMRGHWDSTLAPAGHEWTVEGLVRDLKNFLDALGVDKVHYVGESLGGFLGYHFAHRYPERLKTLSLVCAPGPNFKTHPIGRAGSFKARHPVWGVEVADFGPEDRTIADWYNREAWKSPVEGTYGYFGAAARCEVNDEAFLPGISVPALLLTGAEHTRITSVQEQQRLCNLMPRAKLVTFPGVKVQCQFVMPEKCAQEVVRFVKEQDV